MVEAEVEAEVRSLPSRRRVTDKGHPVVVCGTPQVPVVLHMGPDLMRVRACVRVIRTTPSTITMMTLRFNLESMTIKHKLMALRKLLSAHYHKALFSAPGPAFITRAPPLPSHTGSNTSEIVVLHHKSSTAMPP